MLKLQLDLQHSSSHHIKRRPKQLATLIVLGCLGLCARLVQLQVVNHSQYTTLSNQNIVAISPIPALRGQILDRHGVVLVDNQANYQLVTQSKQVNPRNPVFHQLKTLIPSLAPQLNASELRLRDQKHYSGPVVIASHLDMQQRASFAVNQFRLPGFSIQLRWQRHYPFHTLASQTLGHDFPTRQLSAPDNHPAMGETGIEKQYNYLLKGVPGFTQQEINAKGAVVRTLSTQPPQAGDTLTLTIDAKLQQLAEQLLGNENGAIVVLDPRNGEILALVSHPNIDNNRFSQPLSAQSYHALLATPHTPLFNRAISGRYAPGSTIKPFIALLSLDQQIVNEHAAINDPGWFQIPNTDHVYHDWRPWGHGLTNVSRAIIVSCDTFFYALAYELGIDRLTSILQQFLFGQRTGIDLPQESPGIVPSPAWKQANQGQPWFAGDTVLTGIGQGYLLVTPVQLATATALLATHGQLFTPHLLQSTQLSDGRSIAKQPQVRSQLTLGNQHNWTIIQHAMESVLSAEDGTARNFGQSSYRAAAKTGTAQVTERKQQERTKKRWQNNHLLTIYAPTDHPSVVIACVVEHAGNTEFIARQLLDYLLTKRQESHD